MSLEDSSTDVMPCGCVEGAWGLYQPSCPLYESVTCPICEGEAASNEFVMECAECGYFELYEDLEEQLALLSTLRELLSIEDVD